MRPEAGLVLARLQERAPTLGAGRLLCIDGPSGAGKTTLAEAVRTQAAAAGIEHRVIHMDDLYDGWDGLPRVHEQLATLLPPLAEGRPGGYRRYDWTAGRYAEDVTIDPAPLLVLEGAGSWDPAYAALVTLLVWLDAPAEERLARTIARDGAALEPQLRRWARDELVHLARTGAREHADLAVGTPTGRP
ncbi:uridine kinase family protein [Nocardioides sp. T2.26MG-1]|uniref:uridine kinase family protein n=1 Tax=Nocardioides sp. T2.26MG-1 TaxID=3041166 RepID=UPI0024775C35|nr:4-amino-4-deoxy-L-arabinose transferase [Nocardioides sp. T2.26MG-1]CAI9406394.1 Uridine kinase [Nocardioides sp. T2.26MG-1]